MGQVIFYEIFDVGTWVMTKVWLAIHKRHKAEWDKMSGKIGGWEAGLGGRGQ